MGDSPLCLQMTEDMKQDLDEYRIQLNEMKHQTGNLMTELTKSREEHKIMYDPN